MKNWFLISTLLLMISCASTKKHTSSYPQNIEFQDDEFLTNDLIVAAERDLVSRKVIYDLYFSLESDQPDTVIKSIQILTKANGGYIVKSGKNNIRIRVPSNSSVGITNKIETLGEVVDKNISGKDVTEEYIDLEIKINNIELSRKRYLELMARAENVSAALRVEKELERLRRELNLLKGREKKLSHLVAFVTIDIDVNKGIRPGPLGYIFVGFYEAVKWLFIW